MEDKENLQQIYSHLGVEAFGEDIQNQAIKRIDALMYLEKSSVFKFKESAETYAVKIEPLSVDLIKESQFAILDHALSRIKNCGNPKNLDFGTLPETKFLSVASIEEIISDIMKEVKDE